MPKVYNKYHGNAPADSIYVGRPTKWGNPFSHLTGTTARFRVATRSEAVCNYREWIHSVGQQRLIADIRSELKGKDLVCWCAPKPCHADILLEIANADSDSDGCT